MAEISNLTINISANTDRAKTGIDALIGSLNGLQAVIRKLNPGLATFASNMSKLAVSLKSVRGRARGVAGTAGSAVSSVKNAVSQAVVDNGVASGVEGAIVKNEQLADAQKDVADASNKAADALKKTKTEAKAAGHQATKSSKGFGKLVSAFKRILMYRMLRSLIRAITQSLKEGVNNVYQWSKAMDSAGYGGFAKTMDSLATSFLYLKNSLGAMVAPLIQSLAPAINWIIDRFVDLLNVVNQVFAFLSGKSSWTKAKRVPTEFGEAADKASGAAKELRNVLADFDEINLIDPGKSGGGGGGSSSSLDYEDMFEEVSGFDDIVKKFQPLKDLIETLAPLIKELGDWAANTLLPNVLKSVAYQVSSIATDVKGIIDGIKNGNAYDIVNNTKNLLIDLVYGPLEAAATLVDSIFGTNYAEFIREGMDVLKSFDLAGWAEDTWETIKRWFSVDVKSFFEAAFETVKRKTEALIESAKGLWKGLTTGDFGDYNAAAEKFNSITFESVFQDVKAKNLEIYNEARLAKLKVNAYDGKYDKLAKAAIIMPNSSAKKVLTSVEKGKRWSQVAYQVVASIDKKTGEKTYKTNLVKGGKWQSDAWKVIDAAYAKNASYSLDVNVNPKVKSKIDAEDLINFKNQYIKIYGEKGSVSQLRIAGFASGGFPTVGDLFFANENGTAEMVGSVNGRTAVANNQDIVAGISEGVYKAIVNTGIVSAVKNNKKGSAPVFAPSVEAGRWIQRSLNMYQTVG